MQLDRASIIGSIRAEIIKIAETLDGDASDIQDDESIPGSGYIDSAGLLELIGWFEATYKFKVPAEDFTVDKLGTIDAMADYLLQRKSAA